MKFFLILLLFFLSFISVGQDTNNISISNFGIEINTLMSSRRYYPISQSILNSNFYRENFIIKKAYEQQYDFLNFGKQIGGKIGFDLGFIKKVNTEFNLGIGYQNSGSISDSVQRNSTSYDNNNSPIVKQEASMLMNYTFHEFYSSASLILKKEISSFHLFTGIGMNYIRSKPTLNIEERLKKKLTKSYQLETETNHHINFYIPIGIEYNISKIKNKGLAWRFNYAVRAEKPVYPHEYIRLFSSIDMVLIYKL